MGTCSNIFRSTQILSSQHRECTYSGHCFLCIKKSSADSIIEENIDFPLPKPMNTNHRFTKISNHIMTISECVLPGIDPRGVFTKNCQDLTLVLTTQLCIFACVFDGHGPEGDKVALFCSVFSSNFFKEHWKDQGVEPNLFLIDLIKQCENELLSNKGIVNATNSGSTCVYAIIYESVIYTASLGNSRFVVASLNNYPCITYSAQQDDSSIQNKMRHRRMSKQNKLLYSMQLTKDHVPEDPEELLRIRSKGGKVCRLIDHQGNKIGPYRVWEPNHNSPGLALSRSLGDGNGKKIGISPEPTLNQHNIDFAADLFVIIATDGVWNAMDNEDACNFIDFYREYSAKEAKKNIEDIKLENCCISHLLSEEARLRWISLVEADDVPIDDISCVIIEFPIVNRAQRVKKLSSKIPVKKNIQDLELEDCPEATINYKNGRDAQRGSIFLDQVA